MGRRRRRRHSAQFKAAVIEECMRPGMSIAAVALAHSLNAIMLRKWMIDAENALPHKPKEVRVQPAEDTPMPGPTFRHLERSHVLAQRMTGQHTFIHWRMLAAGLRRGDVREVVGQVPRILASILFSRPWVPSGNSGRARVSAFRQMPVPADLRHLVP